MKVSLIEVALRIRPTLREQVIQMRLGGASHATIGAFLSGKLGAPIGREAVRVWLLENEPDVKKATRESLRAKKSAQAVPVN